MYIFIFMDYQVYQVLIRIVIIIILINPTIIEAIRKINFHFFQQVIDYKFSAF